MKYMKKRPTDSKIFMSPYTHTHTHHSLEPPSNDFWTTFLLPPLLSGTTTDNIQTWPTQPNFGCVWAIENIGLTPNCDLQVAQSRWKLYLAQKKHKKNTTIQPKNRNMRQTASILLIIGVVATRLSASQPSVNRFPKTIPSHQSCRRFSVTNRYISTDF